MNRKIVISLALFLALGLTIGAVLLTMTMNSDSPPASSNDDDSFPGSEWLQEHTTNWDDTGELNLTHSECAMVSKCQHPWTHNPVNLCYVYLRDPHGSVPCNY